jgi:catechol 2,3-dioxygenase-like lactoylglutathione lyase family enzyme
MAIDGIFYVSAQVADLARTKAFYGETLGWRLNTDEPGVAGFWFGSGYLVAVQSEQPGAAGGLSVAVRVDDIEAEHKTLTERGVAVSPIVSKPWGQRDFNFTDPDGYRWEYAQLAARS